jgi:glycosyltransferase involved in cell wall biosynthesis
MNLLYISSKKNWGGVTNWMSRTALGLEQKGHKVWILAHPAGRFVRSASTQLTVIPKKLGMDYNPLMIGFLRRFIQRNRIQLVLTNIEKEVVIGGMAARLCGIPNVRRVGREDDFNENYRVKWHHRLLVDRCIVPCNLIRDNAMKRARWLDGSIFTTIYNGRNPVRYAAQEINRQKSKWGLSEKEVIVGVTSQLSKVKGVDSLVRVFPEIVRKHPACRLVVTGEGKERANLETLARELEIPECVIFSGFTSDPLLAAASYDIAVSSSRFEGFPNTVVEYLAAGRPVVATDAGGVAEMVEHMKNGVLVPCGDEKKLLEGIQLLIANQALRKRLGLNAIRTIEEKFSEDRMLDNLDAFFRETILTYIPDYRA